MKKLVAGFFMGGFLSGSAFAMGPSFFCKSADGLKTVRTVAGPWRLIAKVYYGDSLYVVLDCEQNTEHHLIYCKRDEVSKTFTLNFDEITGTYRSNWTLTDLSCQKVSDTAG